MVLTEEPCRQAARGHAVWVVTVSTTQLTEAKLQRCRPVELEQYSIEY